MRILEELSVSCVWREAWDLAAIRPENSNVASLVGFLIVFLKVCRLFFGCSVSDSGFVGGERGPVGDPRSV